MMLRLAFFAILVHPAWSQVIVSTGKGQVIGYHSSDLSYTTFFGVPYAKVDENNPFGESLPYPNFTTPHDASDSTIRCPQAYFKPGGTLQCLVLNIYVPRRHDVLQVKPVLVWFHGGGFAFGSAGEYQGEFLAKHDVVVVTVNYRLGPYGFLCLDHPSVPGNQGLKDQVAALRWIKENIHSFGGDADEVTIAGESYGGGGVELHLYSEYEKLFDKAIIQSGSVLAQGFFMKPNYGTAKRIAIYLGHDVQSTEDALKALAKEPPSKVMEATKNMNIRLTVCKEKSFRGTKNFITNHPDKLWDPDRVKDTPILVGYNSKEDFDSFINQGENFYKKVGDIFRKKLKQHFVFTPKELEFLSNNIKKFYLGDNIIEPNSYIELSDFSSDFILNWPIEWSVNKLVDQGATVYKYMFSYVGGSVYKNITGVGAIHTEELKYLFGFYSNLTTPEQLLMREWMTSMWTYFVKFGNPTPKLPKLPVGTKLTELLPIDWEPIPVNSSERPYLFIDLEMRMESQAYRERMAFWDLFYYNYASKSVLLKS